MLIKFLCLAALGNWALVLIANLCVQMKKKKKCRVFASYVKLGLLILARDTRGWIVDTRED